MYIKPIIAVALIISATLMAVELSPGINTKQFKEGKYIHVNSIEIAFDKTDANVEIQYSLSAFAESYIFLFGSKNLEPKIREIFANFTEAKILQIGRNSAYLRITNISRKEGQNYLHDSREFGVSTDILILDSPQGTRRLENQNSTVNYFYWY